MIVSNSTSQGEVTALAKNAKDSTSLRTTVPMSIVRQWQLKPKDKILWRWEVIQGKMVVIVNKHEDKNQPTLSKKELKRRK